MIIITKKLHPRRLVAGCALFALALGVLGAGLGLVRGHPERPRPWPTCKWTPGASKPTPTGWPFWRGYGWIVSQEPAAVEDIRLPDTFDASYDEYLSLQKSQASTCPSTPAKPSNAIPIRSPTTPVYRKISGPVFSSIKKRSSAGRSTPTRGTASSRPCPTPPKPERVPPANKDNAARRYPTVGGVSAPHSAGGAPQHPPGGAGQPVHGPGV